MSESPASIESAQPEPESAPKTVVSSQAASGGSTENASDSATETAAQLRKVLVKALLLLGLALLGALAYHATPLKDWLGPAGQASQWVRQAGVAGAVVFVAAMSGLILLGVPRLFFCPVAGALYGFWIGLLLSILGTMASYYAAFRVVRGRRSETWREARLPARLAFLKRNPGLPGVILARLVPVPGMVATLALALSGVPLRTYLLGSLVGLIPEAAPLVLLGSGLLHGDVRKLGELAAVTLGCIVAAWAVLLYLTRRGRKSARSAPAPDC